MIRVEISEKDTRKTTYKTNKAKSRFLEKLDKIGNNIASLVKKHRKFKLLKLGIKLKYYYQTYGNEKADYKGIL